ncbi:MAG: hypothetical protein IT434_02440 [Phycisphaerales bacterium]|jgi:hypothetical protein|nr:hypothetical protein [Phycisphaerales bacterium]
MGKPSGSTIIPAIEFRRETDPPVSLRRRLAATKPTPFLRSVALHKSVLDRLPSPRSRDISPTWLCAVTLRRRPSKSPTTFRSLANWCIRHTAIISGCRAAGITVEAEVRVMCRAYMLSVPLDPPAIAELARLGIPIRVIYHATA